MSNRIKLAVSYCADVLTAIHIPTAIEEAVRDLLRCREDIRIDLLRARHRPSKFLLLHGRRFSGGRAWTLRHDAWLRAQTWDQLALLRTHESYLRAVDETVGRLRAVETDRPPLLQVARLHARVQRLLRRVLIEAAWHYRHPARVGEALRARQEGAPADAVTRAWAAQPRLHRTYRRLAARGKPTRQVVTAVACALTGFAWATLTQ